MRPAFFATYTRREKVLLSATLAFIAFIHFLSFLYLLSLAAQNPNATPYPIVAADSSYYARLADNLLAYNTFTDSLPDLTPTREIAPGYPFFLALIKSVTGSFTPAVILQTAIALFAIVLIYDIGRRFLPLWLALLAAALYGLEPMVVFTNTTILTDGLFSALLVMTIYAAFFMGRTGLFARTVIVGLMLGVLAMMRGTGEYLIVVVPIALAIRELLQRSDGNRLRRVLLTLIIPVVCAALVVFPWVLRNHSIWGFYEVEHQRTGILIGYNVRFFLAWKEMNKTRSTSFFYPARHVDAPEVAIVDAHITEATNKATPPGEDPSDYVAGVALDYIFDDPIRYAYFHLAHLPAFFLGSSIGTYQQVVHQLGENTNFSGSTMYKMRSAAVDFIHGERIKDALAILVPIVAETAFWALTVLLALIGWYSERRRYEVWLCAMLVGYFAILTGPLSIARYRIPAEPYLFLLAAVGVHALATRIRAAFAGTNGGRRFERVAVVFRYLVAGSTAFLTSLTVFALLFYGIGVWYITASICSFLVGFVVSFVLQKFFTFRDDSPPRRGQQVVRYFLVLLFNICANTLLLYLLVEQLHVGHLLAVIIGNVCMAIWSFFIYDRLIFGRKIALPESVRDSAPHSLSDLSVVIPCFNEENSIAQVISAIPNGAREIIVVDNNSTDKSVAIAAAYGARVVRENIQGVGAALRTGFRSATGDIIAVIDGDNQHPAEELSRMLDTLVAKDLDVISASRFPLPMGAPMSILRHFGNWALTLATNLLFDISLTDSQSGMIIFRRRVLARIEPQHNGFAFVQELKILAARNTSIHFDEHNIPCLPRTGGVSKHHLRHGIKLLYALLALRLSPRRGDR